MSQTPVDDFSEASLISYRQGWQALNRLLHENRSFSGHERHCVFLNCRAGAFADVSAVSGLDFPEDGRGVGPVDWDLDGDLDLWITNRTAPRVRLMLNQTRTANAFLSLYLEGDGKATNRDAIGARVEIQGLQQPLVRTKYAGESFLSQSSGWIHLGLGDRTAPVDVLVKWPNGAPEVFRSLAPKAFYVLRQGSGSALPWSPPAGSGALAARATPLQLPPSSSQARIFLTAPLPLPELHAVREGEESAALGLKAAPTLISVWASWCQPCLEELKRWSAAEEKFRQAGVEILAFNADTDSEGRSRAASFLTGIGFPFPSATADPKSLRALDLLQRACLDRWEPMPVPCSFLVDGDGYVTAIYKGGLSVERVLQDARLVRASPEERRTAAAPFPGVWTHDPPAADPLRVTSQFVDFDLVGEGLNYLQRATEMDQRFRAGEYSEAELADRYLVAATLLGSQNRPAETLQAYEKARDLNPRDARVRGDLANYHLAQGRSKEAIEEWKAVLSINPRDLDTAGRLAVTQLRLGQAREALPLLNQLVQLRPDQAPLRYYQGIARQRTGDMPGALQAIQEALRLDPENVLAMNSLAWVLATHPDAQWRNGARALEVATRLCEQTEGRNPHFLMTLAAAQAEAGDTAAAVVTSEKVRARLHEQNRAGSVAAGSDLEADLATVETRLALYKAGKPYRDESL